MQALLTVLAAELERARAVSAQVIKHLTATYGVEREAVGGFLTNELPKLEDYEIDLILSPLFTPTLGDQAVVAELLGRESVPRAQWPELAAQLATRPTRAQLQTEDGGVQSVPLRGVIIERYVNRLRLEASISEPLFKLIATLSPAAGRPLIQAVARRAIWEREARQEILVRYLLAEVQDEGRLAGPKPLSPSTAPALQHGEGPGGVEGVMELLKLMEAYEPPDVASLLPRIPHWEQVLRHEITMAANPKPFFNERVQELHGGGRDHRAQDDTRIAMKERELAFLKQLQQRLAT